MTCCRQHREHPEPNGYTAADRDTILRAYEERTSLRSLTRTFGVSRTTVLDWVKSRSVAATAHNAPVSTDR